MSKPLFLVVLLPAALLGCSERPQSDNDQVQFSVRGLDSGVEPFVRSSTLLAGTRLCADLYAVPRLTVDIGSTGTRVRQEELPPEYAYRCFEDRLEGATTSWTTDASSGPLCVTVDEDAAELRWELRPQQCDWTGGEFDPVDDAIAFPVHSADDAVGVLISAEELADPFVSPGAVDWSPDDRPTPGGRVGVFADATVGLRAGMEAAGERLTFAYTANDAVDTSDGRARIAAVPLAGVPPEVERTRHPGVTLRAAAGAEARLEWAFDGRRLPIAYVVGVPLERIASLEILPAFHRGRDEGTFNSPAGARAVVRDVDGMLVYGAPVQWTMGGALEELEGLQPLEFELREDYVALSTNSQVLDAQAFDPGVHAVQGTLTATLGDLETSVTLNWRHTVDEPAAPVVGGGAGGGCSMSRGRGLERGGLLWLVAALLLVRRRC